VDVLNSNLYEARETSIPDNHDVVSETVGHHHRMHKEVSAMIVQLMEQNRFTKNFGPKRIMSQLHRHNISKDQIPSKIQIQNKLSYHCQTVFNFNNWRRSCRPTFCVSV
jgi:hypothetical protein